MYTVEAGEAARDLLAYLNASPTSFHAVANAAVMLGSGGFVELREDEAWRLERGGKYYVKRNNSALLAFVVGEGDLAENGFRVIGAHADSPGFKVKPGGCMATPDGYVKINTEGYGGAILSTWFDRPLGVAGRVAVRCPDGGVGERLVDTGKPVAVIPNLCIHFNREVNSGYAYNKQVDLLPLLCMASTARDNRDPLLAVVTDAAGPAYESVLDYELFLYECAPGTLMGPNEEFISASRIDNLAMAHAGLMGLLVSEPAPCGKILAIFDNEEVGSATAPGADSTFLLHMLKRICFAYRHGEEDFQRALAGTVALSADAAHAVHPNYPERHDPVNRPVLGGGVAIKYSANQRYVTNAVTASLYSLACERAGVPFQRYVNRSDIVGGSTIGPSMSSVTSIAAVDVGIPMLAMHSIRELAHVDDNLFAVKSFAEFYQFPGGLL